jgi:two-component system cell cycle response regulator
MTGNILIVDDVATNRIVLKVKLGAACYNPLLASDGESCVRIARQNMPDLILLDHDLRDASGVVVLQQLRADPATRSIPVIILSSTSNMDIRMEALQSGADEFLQKPVDDQILLARIRNLVRNREPVTNATGTDISIHGTGLSDPKARFDVPGVVALLLDRPEIARAWRRDLTADSGNHLIIMSREQALADDSDSGRRPDIFVVASELMGRDGGLRLMSELRSRSQTRDAAICIVCTDAAADNAAIAFDLGANDVVATDVSVAELSLRLQRLLRRKREADRMRASVQDSLRASVIDPLTGLHNRRYAMPRLAGISDRARMADLPYSVLVIDLDRFKSVNDHWGHSAGDSVLIEVARRLSSNLREGDLLARVGGEEFLVGLPDTCLAEAQEIAERLCDVVQARPVRLVEGASIPVTISIGLAVGPSNTDSCEETPSAVMERADRALLLAKSAGRNQVTISQTAA